MCWAPKQQAITIPPPPPTQVIYDESAAARDAAAKKAAAAAGTASTFGTSPLGDQTAAPTEKKSLLGS